MHWEGIAVDQKSSTLEMDQGSANLHLEVDSTPTAGIPRKEVTPATKLLLVLPFSPSSPMNELTFHIKGIRD